MLAAFLAPWPTCEYCKGTLGYDGQDTCCGCGAPRAPINLRSLNRAAKERVRYGECLETVNLAHPDEGRAHQQHLKTATGSCL